MGPMLTFAYCALHPSKTFRSDRLVHVATCTVSTSAHVCRHRRRQPKTATTVLQRTYYITSTRHRHVVHALSSQFTPAPSTALSWRFPPCCQHHTYVKQAALIHCPHGRTHMRTCVPVHLHVEQDEAYLPPEWILFAHVVQDCAAEYLWEQTCTHRRSAIKTSRGGDNDMRPLPLAGEG